jgi:hypothetical protein
MRRFSIRWASSALLAAVIVMVGGCAPKQYAISEPKLIVLKTPKIKFADTGYIRTSDDAVEVELFSAGQAAGRITINRLVCVEGEGCSSKNAFNADYLNPAYPDETMKNVLLGRPIFEGRSLKRTAEGFEQELNGSGYEIAYRVTATQTVFRDRINRILIKIKTIR